MAAAVCMLRGRGAGRIYRRVVLCFFDGNGGMQAAAAWRLLMDQVDLMDQMDKMGAPRYTPRVCSAAVWRGSGKIYRRGDYCNRRTNHPIS